MSSSNSKTYTVFVDPGNRQIQAIRGQRLLQALMADGLFIRSDCGGKGLCGKCLVQVHHLNGSDVTPPDEAEIKMIGKTQANAGYRLACRTSVSGDLSIQIPDATLLRPEVMEKGAVLPTPLTGIKRAADASETYGVAVDLGTTTIAVYLCDLSAGTVVASTSIKNPQAVFGDDVMSRISAICENVSDLARFQALAVKAIEWGVLSLCRATTTNPEHLIKMAVVGNSAMIHMLLGENPASIGVFPYTPQFKEAKKIKAVDLGFRFSPSTTIDTLPLVSGFLGADIVGATLAVDLESRPVGTLLVDVGTNGELMLRIKNGFIATSCATGPAFEGACIDHGMHAISGAIDAVRPILLDRKPSYSVIQKNRGNPLRPSGICGTGVISAVAELLRSKILLRNGRFNKESGALYLKTDETGMPEFELAASTETETGRAVTLTQKDIRSIQLAKGALLAGIKLLCREAGIERPIKILLAGAFGNFINKKDAITIGMFPDVPVTNIEIMGNAAGAGAIYALFDPDFGRAANQVTRQTRVLDLASLEAFQDTFVSSLYFPG